MTNVEYTSDRVNVVHGRWDEIRDYTQAGLISFECSECGRLCDTLYRYCPHCGAKMGEYVVGETAPDLVNVVRCRDCKHRPTDNRERDDDATGFAIEFPDGKCPCQCEDGWYNWYPGDDWFCANGERKEDE